MPIEDHGLRATTTAVITSTFSPMTALTPPPPPGALWLTASPPPSTFRLPRSLTSATTLPRTPVACPGAAGAIKELPSKRGGMWRAIGRGVRQPLRCPPRVTRRGGATPPSPARCRPRTGPRHTEWNGNGDASGAPTMSECPRRGAEPGGERSRARLWSGRQTTGARPERSKVVPATTRPCPSYRRRAMVRAAASRRFVSPGHLVPRPTAAAPDPATHQLHTLSSPHHHLASCSYLEARHPPPPPPSPSPCPQLMLRACTTCGGNVGPSSTASSLTLPPGGYRTWFPVPIQTATRRSRTGTSTQQGRSAGRGRGVDCDSGRDG